MKRRLVLLVFFVLAAFTVSGCSPAESLPFFISLHDSVAAFSLEERLNVSIHFF